MTKGREAGRDFAPLSTLRRPPATQAMLTEDRKGRLILKIKPQPSRQNRCYNMDANW